MGMFDNLDNLKDKGLDLAKEHHEKVEQVAEQGAERGGDKFDELTGDKYASQVDSVQEQVPDQVHKFLGGE